MVQLHVDIVVLAGQQAELESAFEKVFKPVISKQPGWAGLHWPEGSQVRRQILAVSEPCHIGDAYRCVFPDGKRHT